MSLIMKLFNDQNNLGRKIHSIHSGNFWTFEFAILLTKTSKTREKFNLKNQ